jgi:hypothetical protein
VAETAVERFLCCGFQHTHKVVGQVYQCWGRICGEINVFSRFEYNAFYVLYLFVTYLLTLSHIIACSVCVCFSFLFHDILSECFW